MATLATVSNRFVDSTLDRSGTEQVRYGQDGLRAFPNEDVYLYHKAIDNSRIVRQSDPQAARYCWKFIFVTFLCALLGTGLLLPGAASMFAGYQIESLRAQSAQLHDQEAKLDLEIATLLAPARLEHLAKQQQFVTPSPDRVYYLNPAADGSSVALNRAP